jgi:DNA-directed RNA polymerase specialized sigma24 family protein
MPAPIITRLDLEWEALRDVAPDWPSRYGVTLDAVLAAIPAQPDPVLAELIAACQTGSTLAGRTVVQAFLGKVACLSVADRRVSEDDAVAALWLRIARYPLARRPRQIAANLALDTRKDVLAEVADPVAAAVPAVPAAAPGEPTADVVLTTAADLGLVPAADLAVVVSVYGDGLPSAAAADRHGLSPAAVRWRCRATLRRLRQSADLLADAARPTHPPVWAAA